MYGNCTGTQCYSQGIQYVQEGLVDHFLFMKFLKKLCIQGTRTNKIVWAGVCVPGQQSDASKLSPLVSCVRVSTPGSWPT